MEPILVAASVGKRFPGVVALADVDLALAAGEVHALVGENGAGKSTLIKVLTGVYQPDGGTLTYRGEPASFGSPMAAQQAGIATVYQEVNLVPLRSVASNLFLGREPRNRLGLLDFRAMNRQAHELLMSRLAEARPGDAVLSEEGAHVEVREEDDELLRAAEELGIDLSPGSLRAAARQPTAEEAEEGQERVDEDGELALPADETLDDLADVQLESGESPKEEVEDEVGPLADVDLADIEVED